MEAEARLGDMFILNPDGTVPNLKAARARPQEGGSQPALGLCKASVQLGGRGSIPANIMQYSTRKSWLKLADCVAGLVVQAELKLQTVPVS